MLYEHIPHLVAAASAPQSLHLLHDIRKAVEVVLLIVFVVGLLLGFLIGRAVGRKR